ncbi:MAG: glycosyltransferase family 39 protein [Chloroflexi bacterium]|nr:glycosyltransferase family 39 protein [Chloroflexota bacterium]
MKRWLPVIILLFAIFTRLHDIDKQSLWHDEGNSLRLAERSVNDLIEATSRDIHPPGYYLLLKGWTEFAGISEFALRLLSAFWGILSVAGTIALGKRLFSLEVGLLAAALIAVNPFAVYYGQEARMYTQLAALSVLSLWLFTGMIARADWRHQHGEPNTNSFHTAAYSFWLGVVNIAGLYTQYTFVFTIAVEIVVFVWYWFRRHDNRLLTTFSTSLIMTALAYSLWAFTAYDQLTSWGAPGDSSALGDRLERIATILIYGQVIENLTVVLAAIPLFLLAVAILRVREWWRISLPLLLVIFSVGGLLLSGAYRDANLKFLLPSQIAFAILLALGAVRFNKIVPRKLPGQVAGILALAVIAGINLSNLDEIYSNPDFARSDYRGIADTIKATENEGDAIILNAPNQAEVFTYYYDSELPVYGLPRGLGGDDAATLAETQNILANHDRIFLVLWGDQERDPNHVVENTLNEQAFFVSHDWYVDVQLAQYVTLGEVAATPAVESDTLFGENLRLTGYTLSGDEFVAYQGDVLGVTLYWELLEPLDKPYRVSIQLLYPDGMLAAQGQDAALDPTATPQQDRQAIVVNDTLQPGEYTLIVSIYDPDNPLQRLVPAQNVVSDNAFLVETIILTES